MRPMINVNRISTSDTPGPPRRGTGDFPGPPRRGTGDFPGPPRRGTGDFPGPPRRGTGDFPGPPRRGTGDPPGPRRWGMGYPPGPPHRVTGRSPYDDDDGTADPDDFHPRRSRNTVIVSRESVHIAFLKVYPELPAGVNLKIVKSDATQRLGREGYVELSFGTRRLHHA